MSADVVVSARNLSKCFQVYRHPVDMFLEMATGRRRHRDVWALRDVSFELRRGEVVGVVGRNGAGKSTLLKILGGTLPKTSGDVQIRGTLSTILELGTGFHPAYTGRQNVYMGGLCLGLSRRDIDRKLDEIIDFSELRDSIDRPLSGYSSGMQARLAFSVAVSVDPEILIVDEALSVGDIRFQRKCFAKFEQLRDDGRTILFVSHAAGTIESICSRALYIKDGTVAADDRPKIVTDLYLKDVLSPSAEAVEATAPAPGPASLRYGNGDVRIVDYGLLDGEGRRVAEVQTGQRYRLVCKARCHRPEVDDLNIGITIRTVHGVDVFAVNPVSQKQRTPPLREGDVLDVSVDATMWLAPGEYFITFGAWGQKQTSHYDRVVDAIHFAVRGDCGLLASSIVNLVAAYEMKVTAPGSSCDPTP